MGKTVNKYTDNKLAEEFDWIVLTGDKHAVHGLPAGSFGTLISSYSGDDTVYAEFETANGYKQEEAIAIADFRVLNVKSDSDLPLIVEYLNRRFLVPKRKNA